MKMPEEITRILTDRISTVLFCPTETAVLNLKKEGFENFKTQIHNVGDVMYDAALFYEKFAPVCKYDFPFVLATIHRQENTDDLTRLKNIFEAFCEIGKTHKVILPIHPRTKKIIQANALVTEGIELIDPVGYFEMISLLKGCTLVATDSGGLQKEAYFFKKPCLTLRDETELVELVESGYNKIVGAEVEKVVESFKYLSTTKLNFSSNLYGNGNAGDEISKKLLKPNSRI